METSIDGKATASEVHQRSVALVSEQAGHSEAEQSRASADSDVDKRSIGSMSLPKFSGSSVRLIAHVAV